MTLISFKGLFFSFVFAFLDYFWLSLVGVSWIYTFWRTTWHNSVNSWKMNGNSTAIKPVKIYEAGKLWLMMMKSPLQSLCLVLLWTPGVQEEEWGDLQWKEKPALLMMIPLAAILPAMGRGKREESRGMKTGGKPVKLFRRLPDEGSVQNAAVASCCTLWPPSSEAFHLILNYSMWVFPREVSHKYFKFSCPQKLWVSQSWGYLGVALPFHRWLHPAECCVEGAQQLQEEPGGA